jgi:hypothetical protein
MKNSLKKTWFLVLITGCLVSCEKNLNRENPNATTDAIAFNNIQGYTEAMAKVYGSFATTGSSGAGSGDIAGIDAGTSDFLRLYWNAEELPTDEALCVWNDPGVPDFHNVSWTSNNLILLGLYDRALYQITVANQFINESSDANLASRGIPAQDATTIRYFRAEARFLRAYQYWVLMDMFGNPPFVTENSPIGKSLPPQIGRTALFSYIESELKAIDPLLLKPQAVYGRADQAADWALLARMYLNAKVYTGTDHSTDAITYAAKVIGAGYSLMPNYANLFDADNNVNNPEVIFPIQYDGAQTQNYGGTTFIINSSITTAMAAKTQTLPYGAFGVPSGGWAGNHSLQTLPQIFGDYSGNSDKRAMFYTTGDTENTTDEVTFTSGFTVTKFTNLTSTGNLLPQAGGVFASTDFPLFRLGEIYLIYAEAVLRGGTGGDMAHALQYFNALRTRAQAATVESIQLSDIINERAKEMYWEATRRTDLIRFGMFTGGDYLWPFKGGVENGTAIADYRALYPLPASDVTVNTNLKQNPGYN